MKTTKLLFLAVVLLCSAQSFGQIKYGVKVGANYSTLHCDFDSDYADEPETKMKLGIQFGFITEIPLIEESGLSLQPALLYNNKGCGLDLKKMIEKELDVDVDDYTGYTRYIYHYIELPVNAVYKYNNLQFMAGPYFALGVSGKFKNAFSFEVMNEQFNNNDIFLEDVFDIKPVSGVIDDDRLEDLLEDDDLADIYRAFDAGLNFGVGYEYNKMQFNINYSLGLTNMTPRYDAEEYEVDEDYTENVIQKNRVLSISVSYFFN